MKRILTTLIALLMVVAMCCGVCFADPVGDSEADVPGEIDMEALSQALGLTEEQMLELAEGTLEVSEVDLSKIDLGAVVEAVGMTEEQAIDMIEEELDLGIDLSNVELSKINVEDLADALGFTDEDIQNMLQGDMEQVDVDLFDVNVGGVVQSIGLDAEQTKEAIGAQMGIDEDVLEIVDLEQLDLSAIDDALGLTEDQFDDLLAGNLDFNDVELSNVDLGALVNAVGMTEEQAVDLIKHKLDIGYVDLSGVALSEIDLGKLADAIGLTDDDLNKMVRGEWTPENLDITAVNPKAITEALGISDEDMVDIALSAAGFGHVDWRGIVSNILRGVWIGLGAGVLVVILIIVLLAVSGRKRRTSVHGKQSAQENVSEESL